MTIVVDARDFDVHIHVWQVDVFGGIGSVYVKD